MVMYGLESDFASDRDIFSDQDIFSLPLSEDSYMFQQKNPARKGPPIRNQLIRSHNSTPCTRSSTPSANPRASKLQTIFKRDSPLIPVTLTLDQVMEYESAFRMYDINGDGVISVLEFKTLLHTVGLKPSDEEVMEMIESVDIDDNGVLSLCEFIRLMSNKHKPFVTPKAQFEAVFRAFDSDGNGQLSREEFKKSLFSVGQRCSEDEFENLMGELDRNMDGRISKKEFLSVFLTQE
ncbi:uncharacterized protein LOC134817290 isoform X2 [Bolinopsis microptera]|uniref:uncharacterized protein LOC134817290 isoform X2 n=1 Tax=Bolinopsis microptera TaxID=2820187 RepID=UPI003079D312